MEGEEQTEGETQSNKRQTPDRTGGVVKQRGTRGGRTERQSRGEEERGEEGRGRGAEERGEEGRGRGAEGHRRREGGYSRRGAGKECAHVGGERVSVVGEVLVVCLHGDLLPPDDGQVAVAGVRAAGGYR